MKGSPWKQWPSLWQAALKGCKARGGEAGGLIIVEPATEQEVQSVEAEVGMRLPESFRTVLLQFSSRVELAWDLPDDAEPPVGGVFWGSCCWDLTALADIERDRRSWVAECFPDADDPYARVWHDKLAFLDIANGDKIAFDLAPGSNDAVVYLSHDDGEGHGYLLGHDFVDFVTRWSLLGCPGPENWTIMPFLPSPTSGLDPYSEDAQQWRQWLGMEPDAS